MRCITPVASQAYIRIFQIDLDRFSAKDYVTQTWNFDAVERFPGGNFHRSDLRVYKYLMEFLLARIHFINYPSLL